TVTVFEPRSGVSFAQGTRRTVRWDAPGCLYSDITLDGAIALATNAPNTGYAIVTMPAGASIGAHAITVSCKDASGTNRGLGSSASFNVSSSNLQLLAPGRDQTVNTGGSLIVAWKKAASVATVSVDLSTNGG